MAKLARETGLSIDELRQKLLDTAGVFKDVTQEQAQQEVWRLQRIQREFKETEDWSRSERKRRQHELNRRRRAFEGAGGQESILDQLAHYGNVLRGRELENFIQDRGDDTDDNKGGSAGNVAKGVKDALTDYAKTEGLNLFSALDPFATDQAKHMRYKGHRLRHPELQPQRRVPWAEIFDKFPDATDATKDMSKAFEDAVSKIHAFSFHLGNVFNKIGLGGVGKGIQAGIGAIEMARGGISAFKTAKAGVKAAGGLKGIAGAAAGAGPLLPLVAAGVGIFAFMKIRAKRRERREKQRAMALQRMHLETIRALNPYRHISAGRMGSIGRYWHEGTTDPLRRIGGPPKQAPAGTGMAGSKTQNVTVTAPITVNAAAGQSAPDIAQEVQRQLSLEIQQAAADFG